MMLGGGSVAYLGQTCGIWMQTHKVVIVVNKCGLWILFTLSEKVAISDNSTFAKQVAFLVSLLQPLDITVKKVVEHENQSMAAAYYSADLNDPASSTNAIVVEMHSFLNERDAKIKQLSVYELLM